MRAHSRGGCPLQTAGHKPMRAKIPPTISPKDRNCRASFISCLPTLIQDKFPAPVSIIGKRFLIHLVHYVVAQHKDVNLRAHDTAIGVLWRTDDWFATHVEGGIDNHAIARFSFKCLE